MQYVPRKPRDDVNVSDTHPLVEASTLVLGLGAIVVAIILSLVMLVDISLRFVSPDDEVKLFKSWSEDDFNAIEPDPRSVGVQALLVRLSRHWPDSPYSYRVAVRKSTVPNALALPGGNIVLTSALMDSVESENELAFILGHELGHFHNRDHLRSLGRVAVFGLVLAVVGVGSIDADFGASIADVSLRNFSRGQESDADEFALDIVQGEYGHVNGATGFFKRLLTYDRPLKVASYLSTHPAAEHRIAELEEIAERKHYAMNGDLAALEWSPK